MAASIERRKFGIAINAVSKAGAASSRFRFKDLGGQAYLFAQGPGRFPPSSWVALRCLMTGDCGPILRKSRTSKMEATKLYIEMNFLGDLPKTEAFS